jgi:hypothetical protein
MRCKYWSEDVERVNLLVEILYEDLGEGCGGLLHIVLDDGNLEDHHILWCRAECDNRENWNRHDRLLCKRIANEMLGLTMEQRKLVYYNDVGLKCDRNCDECPICQEETW